MKTLAAVLAVGALLAAPVLAALYTDATNDIAFAIPILDISGAEVTNDFTNIKFTVQLVGDIQATDWGKYMVGIDSGLGGDTNGNGWARPIAMSSGMNAWLGGWVDGPGGLEAYNYVGASWVLTNTYAVTINPNSVEYTVPLGEIGLAPGDTIDFDIYSSGGGGSDGAIDALANPSQTVGDWGNAYDSGANVYTYNLIPEPTVLALAGLGLLGLLFARRG
jgi:hypothetical protein